MNMKKFLFSFCSILSLTASSGVHAQNIYTYAGIASPMGGYTGDGNYAVMAQLSGPAGIAVAPSGVVYICDGRNAVVRKVSTSGIISTFAGNGTAGYSGDGGAATDASISPTAVAVDRSGNVYVVDNRNNVVRKIDGSGTINTIAGDGTGGYTGDGAAASAAELNRPSGIAIDTAGNIFISDSRNFVVRKINTSGVISTYAGSGTAGSTGDGGAASSATFNRPGALAVKTDGTLYVADGQSNVIRAISASGTINAFAGTGTAGYSGDGAAATAATLSNPNGLAVDGSGNVYVADGVNNVVRKINGSGVISTYAGNHNPGYYGDGGAATLARLQGPNWVAVDASANLYITDGGNNVIRRVGEAVRSITITTATHDTVCAGRANAFTATAYADSTPHYQWQVNGTNVGRDTFYYSSTSLLRGDRVVCFLLDSAGGHQLAISNVMAVDSVPSAGIIIGPTTLCVGSIANYRDSSTTGIAGPPPPGTWSVSNTTLATLSTFPPGQVTALAVGTDTVIFTTTNRCGVARATQVVTITANPYGAITGPDHVCAGATVTFTDTPSTGNWAINPARGGNSIDASGNFTAGFRPGVVYVMYGAPGCFAMDSIIVDSAPRVAPVMGATTVWVGASITLTDMAPGGTWTSSSTAIATVDASGNVYGVAAGIVTISYTITGSNGCSTTRTLDVTVEDHTLVNNIQANSSYAVVPNPASSNAQIVWNGVTTGTLTITITEVTGKVVATQTVQTNNQNGAAILNTDVLHSGIYLVQINNGSSVATVKLVKE